MGLVNLWTALKSLAKRYSFVPLFLMSKQGLDQGLSLGCMILVLTFRQSKVAYVVAFNKTVRMGACELALRHLCLCASVLLLGRLDRSC